MKAVILAGGFGTRLSEETTVRPKPMVEIGDRPILWHIMKIYSAHGIRDFIVCCGYKGDMIKQFFADYFLKVSNVRIDLARNEVELLNNGAEPWTVTLVDTGLDTMTGGRVRRVRDFIGNETFCLTYGDGVSDIDIGALVDFHRDQKSTATLTAVRPPGRFGAFQLRAGQTRIESFREKPQGDGAWINGGFFVCEPAVMDYIEGDDTVWEREPLERLADEGRLSAFQHRGFWHPMDTLHDKTVLERLWESGDAPWKTWD